jgi:hypothetical protein
MASRRARTRRRGPGLLHPSLRRRQLPRRTVGRSSEVTMPFLISSSARCRSVRGARQPLLSPDSDYPTRAAVSPGSGRRRSCKTAMSWSTPFAGETGPGGASVGTASGSSIRRWFQVSQRRRRLSRPDLMPSGRVVAMQSGGRGRIPVRGHGLEHANEGLCKASRPCPRRAGASEAPEHHGPYFL